MNRNLVAKRTTLRLLGAAALALGLSHCSQQPPPISKLSGYAQGTTYHLSWWAEKPADRAAIEQDINSTLAQIDKELSTYRDDSYISHFNHSQSTDWQSASKDFIALIDIAKDIDHKTGGCYDPTIGPLFTLWGFQNNKLHVPSAEQIAAVKADLGMDKIEVDHATGRIRKTVPGLQLSFSSMGEGYSIGKISQVLERHGVKNYLVEFGGDMKIKGHKPGGKKWRIAIQRPDAKSGEAAVYQIVTINDENGVTLDTSGTYRHHFDANGKRYSHILDPRSGAPVTHDLVSASVFGTDPRVSDAWATAMLCLGPKEGKAIADRENLPVFFIEDANGTLKNSESSTLQHTQKVTLQKD